MASSQYRKKPRDAFGAFEQRVLRRRRGWTVVIGPEIRYIASRRCENSNSGRDCNGWNDFCIGTVDESIGNLVYYFLFQVSLWGKY